MKIRFEYGDLVMYCLFCKEQGEALFKPKVGRYLRKESGYCIIKPEGNGNIIKRKPEHIVKLAAVYLKHKDDIKKQTWSLQ